VGGSSGIGYEWCLTGEPTSAAEAKEGGLLNYVVSALERNSMTQWLIDCLAGKSPTAIRRGKFTMRAMGSMSFDGGTAHTENQIALLAIAEDAKESLASLNEKRLAVWRAR
jgi:enoyl-CoA hydratase/carnithine racemase